MISLRKKKTPPPVKVVVIDDSVVVEKMMRHILKTYMEDKFAGHIQFNLIFFNSFSAFIKGNGSTYDVAFVDWNLGGNINEMGDKVAEILKDECDVITILTGGIGDPSITDYSRRSGVPVIYKNTSGIFDNSGTYTSNQMVAGIYDHLDHAIRKWKKKYGISV